MKTTFLLFSLVLLMFACNTDPKATVDDRQAKLQQVLDNFKGVPELTISKKEQSPSQPIFESRTSTACQQWIDGTGQCDCCNNYVYLSTYNSSYLNMGWTARNCVGAFQEFGNCDPHGKFKLYFWLLKNGSGVGSGSSTIEDCSTYVWHDWHIPLQGSGTYQIFYFIGSQSGQYCAMSYSNTLNIS